jgi:hypothetical protein
MWLTDNWQRLFAEHEHLDVAIIGGWPFFQSISVLRAKGVKTWFQDCGITPTQGLSDGVKKTLSLLWDLKRHFLPQADGLLPISHFISTSQSWDFAPPTGNVYPVHLGADHVRSPLWRTNANDKLPASGPYLVSVGRFEPGIYKQSEQVFDLARALANEGHQAPIYVIGLEPSDLPDDIKHLIR